jgi:hypothetical protein
MDNFNRKVANTQSLNDALYHAIQQLLYKKEYDVNSGTLTDPFISSTSVTQALNEAIGYGGGFTLRTEIGGYWLFHYAPGIKASITKNEGENLINIKISRSLIIKVAEKCLSEFKGLPVQLSLFV